MAEIFWYLAGAACLATLGVLAFGVGGFGSGKLTPQLQNKMMRWRIAAQAIAVVLILLTAWAARG
ncbi:MAG: twin transmembrane helix small protein [Pseudomonadota bacterium]